MARPGYTFTPARAAALRKAQLASAEKRRGRRLSNRRHYGHDPVRRGVGTSGLSKNATPYARVNKRSQTIGINTGTIIPGTNKRIALGGYVRLENRNKNHNLIDRHISGALNRHAGKGTKAGTVRQFVNKNVHVDTPGVRVKLGGSQARLGTSRGGGPTVIIRRGAHKVQLTKSQSGVRRYNKRVVAVTKLPKTRKARRGRRRR